MRVGTFVLRLLFHFLQFSENGRKLERVFAFLALSCELFWFMDVYKFISDTDF